jgi:hypothetical protein
MNAIVLALLAAAPSGTATVPLEELVSLLDGKKPEVEERGEAAITRLALTGHPGEAGLWLDGEVTVRPRSGTYAVVPLLEVGPETVVEALPEQGNAVVELKDGVVTVGCSGAEPVRVTFKLLVRAEHEGRRSVARFKAGASAPPTALKLDVDDGLFEVPGATVVREWGGYVVFPTRRAYVVAWASRQDVAAKPMVVQRAPIDPKVKEASSKWVTTLEGRATHEVKLTLQLDRPGILVVDAPEGQKLVRARVNGVSVALDDQTKRLSLEVSPAALGASEAVVELALSQDLGVFHLSGALELAGPKVSWPVAQWTTQTVLPKVFTYARRGGSMEQVGNEGEAQGEVPGKALFFTQHLIASTAPVVFLGYSVDIKDSYFR